MTTLTKTSSPVLHDEPASCTRQQGALVAAGEDKPPMPADPESLDATRPVDVDTCGVCMGDGALRVPTGHLYAREFDMEPCWNCHGNGQRGAA